MDFNLFYFIFSFLEFKVNVVLFLMQEQLLEQEQTILDLERKMEEKDREIHAIKLDNEAVCRFGCCFSLSILLLINCGLMSV